MKFKLGVSISLLFLAVCIFVVAAFAQCTCDANASVTSYTWHRFVSASGAAGASCSGSYSMWAEVGSDEDSASNAFTGGFSNGVSADGYTWEFYEGVSTIWTYQGCSDSDSV